MAWHNATEPTRQRALAADTELRRRHPGIDLPPLHPQQEDTLDMAARAAWPEPVDVGSPAIGRDQARLDIDAAVTAASRATRIIAAREQQPRQAADVESDDVMRQHQARALRQGHARRSAVRQEPLPSRRTERQAQPDLEPEAGG